MYVNVYDLTYIWGCMGGGATDQGLEGHLHPVQLYCTVYYYYVIIVRGIGKVGLPTAIDTLGLVDFPRSDPP
jgi:hypothetical protein